jgi:hypothetical protein
MAERHTDMGIWHSALRKTIRVTPFVVLIGLVPAAVDGPATWSTSTLLNAVLAGLFCAPMALLAFAAADWMAKR